MKIALARPRIPTDSIGLHNMMICDPLELEVVAAGIPKKHEVVLYDGILDEPENFDRMLKEFDPDIVGFTTYINGVNQIGRMMDKVKAHRKDTLIAAGGVHVTRNGEDFSTTKADVLIQGEGTFTFAKMIEAFEDSGLRNLKAVQGVRVREGEGYSKTTTPPYPHPDQIPFARRELTRQWWPSYYYIYHNPCHLIKTAWGCPYTCSFCYCWQATEGHYSFRSPEAFVAELEQMWSPNVYIVDDDFFLHPTRMMKIHDLLVKKGIKKNFFCYGRSDFIAKHPDIIRAWSKIGLQAVVVGVESYSDSELEYFNKESTAAVNVEAFKVLREANVDPYASFILNPNWGLADFKKIQQYIYDNKLYYVILQPLMPLPGTAIWDEWKDVVIIDRDHHEIWDISHLALPSRLPMKTYFREMVKLYLRTCLNLLRLPNVTLRTLPPIYSPRAAEIPHVLFGGLRVLSQLWNAHRRYRPAELARYEKGSGVLFHNREARENPETEGLTDYRLVQKRIEMAEASGGVAPSIEAMKAQPLIQIRPAGGCAAGTAGK
ncbi:MAG: cobalamin B12-binding domain-containing protein [Candidatus Wallbacteria bacterium]|nr:cobalamin B12-binding domain-containing protein [Candidatus Wallbacteria bacterium]